LLTEVIESAQGAPEHYIERTFLLLRQGNVEDTSLVVAPNGAPIIGTLLQALTRKQAEEPYGAMIDSLDTIEGDLNNECDNYLNSILSLFGDEDAGSFLEAQLRELLREGIRSKAVETVLGRILMSLERDEDAQGVLLAVLNRFGPDKWLHYYLATVYEALDQVEETENHLRACLKLDPNDPDVMNFLGYVFAEENMNLDEAEDLLERALQLDPENGFYLDSLGWIYYRKGDAERAIDLITRAIRAMATDDAILRDHLGDAYLLKGMVGKALGEWKRALRLDPDLEGVEEKIEKYMKELGE